MQGEGLLNIGVPTTQHGIGLNPSGKGLYPVGNIKKGGMSNKNKQKSLKVASTILKSLAAIGGISGLSKNKTHQENLHTLLGSALLYASSKGLDKWADKYKEGSGYKEKVKEYKKKLLKFYKERIKPHHKEIITAILNNDMPIHITDLVKDKKKLGNLLMLLEKIIFHPQTGSGKFKIKKIFKNVGNTLHRFVKGETKIKPSHLLKGLAKVVEAAGVASAVIPGVNIISAPAATALSFGLESAGEIAKSQGRGSTTPMISGMRLSKKGKPLKIQSKEVVFKSPEGMYKTKQGKTKKDFMLNKRGKIVSKKKHEMGLKNYERNKEKLKPYQFKKK